MARRDTRARACIRCILLRQPLVINSLYHALASERPYPISSATTFAYVPASFGPTCPGARTEHVHDIAPDPAFLLCFPIQIRCISSIHLDVACDALYGMFPMAESTKTTMLYALSPAGKSQQQRYTVAALVYFLYGVCYFFGSQYFMSMQDTERGMAYAAYATFFFIVGGLITVVFPLLIYSRFALAVSWYWRPHAQYKTLHISFTMLLGFLVFFRGYVLLHSNAFMKTPLHMAALIITVINATCLFWAGVNRPVWVTRESVEPS